MNRLNGTINIVALLVNNFALLIFSNKIRSLEAIRAPTRKTQRKAVEKYIHIETDKFILTTLLPDRPIRMHVDLSACVQAFQLLVSRASPSLVRVLSLSCTVAVCTRHSFVEPRVQWWQCEGERKRVYQKHRFRYLNSTRRARDRASWTGQIRRVHGRLENKPAPPSGIGRVQVVCSLSAKESEFDVSAVYLFKGTVVDQMHTHFSERISSLNFTGDPSVYEFSVCDVFRDR